MQEIVIQPCSIEHLNDYGEVFSRAFSGEPWNEHWKIEDATSRTAQLLGAPEAYGLEYLVDGQVVGFILGSYAVFHFGRTFEISELAVLPEYQSRGIATRLVEECLAHLQTQDIKAVHLITAAQGGLTDFYGKFGFKREDHVLLMGLEL